jgi:NADPH-dependent 2,4-dienoyl-CoA reductase/sulfur reductase-like enzyme
MRILCCLCSILVLLVWVNSALAQQKAPHYDVVVYGGTASGVIAAYTAARMGKSVLLIEPAFA